MTKINQPLPPDLHERIQAACLIAARALGPEIKGLSCFASNWKEQLGVARLVRQGAID